MAIERKFTRITTSRPPFFAMAQRVTVSQREKRPQTRHRTPSMFLPVVTLEYSAIPVHGSHDLPIWG